MLVLPLHGSMYMMVGWIQSRYKNMGGCLFSEEAFRHNGLATIQTWPERIGDTQR